MLKWFRKKEDELPEGSSNGSSEEGWPAYAESNIQGDEPQGNQKGFFHRLKERLTKTRETFVGRVDQLVLGKKEIDEDLLDDLEEILITSDLGVDTTQALIALVQQKVKRRELDNPERLRETLQEIRQEARSAQVVRLGNPDVLPPRLPQPAVPLLERVSAVLLVEEHPHPRIARELREHLAAVFRDP